LIEDASQWLERTEVDWRSSKTLWGHFREVFLPGLRRASRGEVRLVGVRPRSARELTELGAEHRHQIIGLPHGLVDEALVEFGLLPTPQQQSLADAHYAATRSARREFRLLCRYLMRVLAEVAGAPQV
jgi:lipopolysaccharide/colanic/teichoic acid biosynthesis glycosyltransferase